MTEKVIAKASAEVKALRIVLIILLVVYGASLVGSLLFVVRVFPVIVHPVSRAFFWGRLRILLDYVLTVLVYLYICYHIFRLISPIASGETFNPAIPRHIRGIAYAVFGLGVINAASAIVSAPAFSDVMHTLSRWSLIVETTMKVLYGGLSTVLLGFGFLVIASVLEAGVRLQRDQDLTV